jgi:hypothetical protein
MCRAAEQGLQWCRAPSPLRNLSRNSLCWALRCCARQCGIQRLDCERRRKLNDGMGRRAEGSGGGRIARWCPWKQRSLAAPLAWPVPSRRCLDPVLRAPVIAPVLVHADCTRTFPPQNHPQRPAAVADRMLVPESNYSTVVKEERFTISSEPSDRSLIARAARPRASMAGGAHVALSAQSPPGPHK